MIKDFKSFVFVSVDVKGVADAFFVSVDVKGLTLERPVWDAKYAFRRTVRNAKYAFRRSVRNAKCAHPSFLSLTFPDCGLSGGLKAGYLAAPFANSAQDKPER